MLEMETLGGREFSPPIEMDSRIAMFLSQKPLPKCHPQQSQLPIFVNAVCP